MRQGFLQLAIKNIRVHSKMVCDSDVIFHDETLNSFHQLMVWISGNRDNILKELEENGVVVIPNVLTDKESDDYISRYKAWFDQFDDNGVSMQKRKSVIQSYRVGHFQESWEIRLKSKKIFEMLWGTKKLLSSIDGIAISTPRTEGEGFREEHQDWLHLDQGAQRSGLHAYQGAVYLEEQTKDDYCFRVLPKSHKYHSEFFTTFPNATKKTQRLEFYKLHKKEKDFYYKKGCKLTCVPVPKGGIVVWDSRTVHDNAPPVKDRVNNDRWRFVVFVSMTPAIWANEADLEFKRDAYKRMLLTSHWSSNGMKTFKEYKTNKRKRSHECLSIDHLPDIARSSDAKLLAGVEKYDFNDEIDSNGPSKPKWKCE